MNMLDPRPARTDLTDRELTKFFGAVLSGMLQMTDIVTLRNAVKWWADNDKAWDVLEAVKEL